MPKSKETSRAEAEAEKEKSFSRWSTVKPTGLGPDDVIEETAPLCLSSLKVGTARYRYRRRTAQQRVQEMRENSRAFWCRGRKPSGRQKTAADRQVAAKLMTESIEDRNRLLRFLSNSERAEYRRLRAIELRELSKKPRSKVQERRFRRAIAAL